MNKVCVSVLMPVYNSEKYLRDAMESVLSQTFQDFEFLIINDGSTDGSTNVIKSYKDERIILVQKTSNTGISDSLNLGISRSKGEYIARMDSDDISLPHRFERQVEFLRKNQSIVLCGTNFKLLQTNEVITTPSAPDDIKVNLLNQSCIAHPSVMFRKKTFLDNDVLYDANDEPAEDYNLWVKLSKIGLLSNIDEVLIRYRVHEEQVSNNRKDLQEKNADKARIQGIKQLLPGLSEDEARTHLSLIKSHIGPVKQLIEVFSWGDYLIKVNDEKNIFDNIKFSTLIQSKKRDYARKFFFYSDYNYDTFKLLYLEDKRYYKYFTGLEQLKLSIKCVFKYKNGVK